MFLNYAALGMLIVGAILVFYTFVYIHDLPHKIAERRKHPHAEAIGIACWLSLLTLHVIWPIVFIWAMTKQDAESDDDEGASTDAPSKGQQAGEAPTTIELAMRIEQLANRIESLESTH